MPFKEQILAGIPKILPEKKEYPKNANRAPKRKDILSVEEKQLAIKNALRYFPKAWHSELASEFANELKEFGRIYMYRFKPEYKIYARAISEYPAKTQQARNEDWSDRQPGREKHTQDVRWIDRR